MAEDELSNRVAARIKTKLDEMMNTLPPGYRLVQGGEHEETMKAQVQVVRAVLIAVLFIVLVLIVQYNSLLNPLVIFLLFHWR